MGPLVDYSSSSSSSSSSDGEANPPKKRKISSSSSVPSQLPPLPPSFHDLYASTVRTTTTDDPALHQGRKRLIPHVAGNWPSHIYIEWHPAAAEHALLTRLVEELRASLEKEGYDDDDGHDDDHDRDDEGSSDGDGWLLGKGGQAKEGERESRQITSFLTSDLGSPLPLHISLSRPIVLRTEDKDSFLDEVTASLRGGPRGYHHHDYPHQVDSSAASSSTTTSRAFKVGVHDLAWHRSPDSDRSFLVLRVCSSSSSTSSHRNPSASKNSEGMTATSTLSEGDNASQGRGGGAKGVNNIINPELTTLLARCNEVVAQYGQPRLYARRGRQQQQQRRGPSNAEAKKTTRTGNHHAEQLTTSTTTTPSVAHGSADDDMDKESENAVKSDAPTATATASASASASSTNEDEDAIDETAFHVSIAWSFAKPTPTIQKRTAAVFKSSSSTSSTSISTSISTSSSNNKAKKNASAWQKEIRDIKIPVENVKVKIGNVVTNIPLTGGASGKSATSKGVIRGRGGDRAGGGLFGV